MTVVSRSPGRVAPERRADLRGQRVRRPAVHRHGVRPRRHPARLDRRAPAGRRRPRELLNMYIQAGRVLAAAHAEGLVHRDFLSPTTCWSATTVAPGSPTSAWWRSTTPPGPPTGAGLVAHARVAPAPTPAEDVTIRGATILNGRRRGNVGDRVVRSDRRGNVSATLTGMRGVVRVEITADEAMHVTRQPCGNEESTDVPLTGAGPYTVDAAAVPQAVCPATGPSCRDRTARVRPDSPCSGPTSARRSRGSTHRRAASPRRPPAARSA